MYCFPPAGGITEPHGEGVSKRRGPTQASECGWNPGHIYQQRHERLGHRHCPPVLDLEGVQHGHVVRTSHWLGEDQSSFRSSNKEKEKELWSCLCFLFSYVQSRNHPTSLPKIKVPAEENNRMKAQQRPMEGL